MSDNPTRQNPPSRTGRELERPRWTVTRREETRHSPSRSTSPFQSRSVTTTERVHIVQLPVSENSQVSPAHILALSPHGNTSQSVSSIVTTNQAEGVPLIGALTASGVPLFNGILFNRDSKQTTTIITTTTTTYKILEVSDSDSLSDDYELVDDNTLTVDIDLTERATSPSYVIVSKSESHAPMSPVTKAKLNIELEIPPKTYQTERIEHEVLESTRDFTSEMTESQYTADDERQPSTPGSDEFEKFDMDYPIHQAYDDQTVTTTSKTTNIEEIPLNQHVDLYHNQFFYDQIPGPSTPKPTSKNTKKEKHIKKFPSHLDYPVSESYDGPLDSTSRASNIHDIPLTTEVHSYPTEFSYEKLPEHVIPVVIEESEKKDEPSLKSKITGLFKKSPSHLDYPVSESYDGPLDSTSRASNIHDIPLTTEVHSYPTEFSYEKLPEHVIPVVIEETEKKDEPSLKSKITGLFKKSPSHLDYPVSESYDGPLESTSRASNIHDIPLTTEVHSYPTEFSYEKQPEHVIPVVMEETEKKDEKSPSHLDYPVSESYDGPLESTSRASNIHDIPLTTEVHSYPTEFSYEKLPEHVIPVVIEESEKKDEPSLKSKITGLFKKSPSHLDYPVSESYDGPLESTSRASNIHDIPLTTEVHSYPTEFSYEKLPEHVIPVVIEESEKKDEPSLKSKITGLFKKSPSHLDYPVSESYDGPLESTSRASNIHDIPLTTEVHSYPTEFSYEKQPEHVIPVVIEETEKKDEPSLKSKITGLFKKSPSHLDYPVSESYDGPLESTSRASNIHDIPLTTEVHSYPTEFSYEKLPEHVIPVVIEESEKKDEPSLKSKITGLFKKSPSHLDYPVSESYDGPLESTSRASNIHDIPLTTEVHSYPTEFSYEKLPEHVIPVVIEESEKKDEPSLKSKITGLFKKSPSHLDYPVSESYDGPLDSTSRASNIHDIPLTTEVHSYPTEFSYEKLPEHVIPVVIEESEKKDEPSLKSKITGLFKKSPSHLDYPVSESYDGPLETTSRASNIHDIPLTTEVHSYPTEFSYEKLPEHVIPVVIEESEKKDEPSLKSKITGLFKKSPSHLDYPVSESYDGPLETTSRASNIHDIPLTTEVHSYPTEFSYEKQPEHVIPVVIEETEKKDEPSLKSKITGLFKKSPSHLDYPVSESYDGPLDSTSRASNIHDIPFTTEVHSYPTEFSYEKLPEHVIPVVIEESEKKDEPSLKSKITGLFKKSPSHLDYPVSESYDGPLESTSRASNIHDIPLTTEVHSYPTEFSYEKLPEHVIPVVIEESEKKDEPSLKSKITGLFKKSPSHLDYPVSESYDGPLESTSRASNIHDIPLTTEVHSYPTEFSYEKLPEHVIPVVIEETEKKDEPSLKSKITGLFKKSPSHLDYPVSESYDGPLESTSRASNIHDIPLTTEVHSYPTEFSYEKQPEHVIPVVMEETEKKDEPSLKSKITGLFKKSPSHLDYPVSESYDGPLESTSRASNIHDIPLTTEVHSYPTEFSYEKLPEHVIPVVIEETEKKDEPSLKSKITGLFKKSPSHLDYPVSESYDGPLESTSRASNIHDIPLTTEVHSYPTEFSYEKLPEHVIPVVIEESEKKDEPSLKSKITGLFKKSPSHLDYPVSESYDGPLESTSRASNIHDIPLTTEVHSYPTEFSYEKLPEHVIPVVIEESEKKDEPSLKFKITGLFKKSPSHLDYPVSESYDGPLDSTSRASNIHDIPLTTEVHSYPTEFSYEKQPEHVIPVVIEETEKKDEPSLKSKITGLFKKSPSHLDYPVSESYDGPLESTSRASNIHDIPLTTEVHSYPTEFSYEKQPEHVIPVVIEETEKKDEPSLKSKITGLFKKSPSHLDYPVSESYDGPLESTSRASNIHDIPLTTLVHSYPTEFSYEKQPEHVIPVVIEETEKKDEPSLKSKITGLFKKSPSHLDYPVSESYDGPLESTSRASNIHDIPLTTLVHSYPTEFSYEKQPEHVIPVVIEETEKKDEPSLKSKITGLFKKSPSHLDYPVSESYDGPLESTSRASNIHDIPLTTEVHSYPTEFSYEKLPEHVIPVVIEESEKKDEPSLKSKITGLFKKSPSHLDYPVSESYDGPLDSTHRADNLNDIPLSHEVTSYPTEFSYEKLPEHVIPVVIEETEKKDEPSLKSKITGMFKKSSAHSDYPISEQYDGPLDSTHRADNLNDIPLSHEVTSYPTEFSYEKLPEHVIPVVIEETEKKDEPSLKSKITGLFKKSSAHSDYPISEQYDGPLDSTHRADNLNDIPLSHEVTSYPTEFSYEKLPEHVIPVVIEESEKKNEPSLKSKITGLFKKSPSHLDYPISEQYDGPLDSTHRADNLNDIPLSHEVTSYPTEFSYEKLPEHVIPVVIEETEKKDEPSLKSKITGLFKKSPSHLDYPISEQYDGPLDSTHRADNLNDIPLSHEVTSYPTEFSYEKLPEHVIPVVIEETEKKDEPSLKSKITGLFKKSSAHSDYPISDQYDGPLDSTHRADDVQDVPLSHEVTSYPTEFSYEKLPEHVIPVVIEETEKKDEPSLKSKITGLFKKSSAHSDYPISEQYDGPLDSTHRADNLNDIPLSHEVTSYPTEFSYEKLPEHFIPVVIEESEKKDEPSLKSKITGLFKKSPSHLDYPISEQYDGPLDSTHRADNLNDIPLSHEVTSYPTEFSYEKLPEHVIPVVIEETEKKDEPSLKSKITGMFKKSSAHSDYPISEQYDGPLDSTHRADNLNDIPLSHEVTSYPTEFSYEKLPEHVIPVVIEETEKKDEPSLKSKITGLFKKSSAHSDYPISEQYDGPLDSTHRADNLNDIPLSHEVTSYPTEFSYEKLPEHFIPVVIEESEKKDEPLLKSKITGLFKKSSAHSDYPISEQYDGPLDSTHRADNLNDIPLSHEVTSYPTEFSYEKLPEHVIPVVIEETEKKDEPSLKSKITGMFKKSSAHSDYPISEQYDGPLDSTHRADNLNDIPLSHEVTSYPTEFSYEKLPEHFIPVVIEESEKKDEPSLKSKITGLFKKSSAHSDYPISEQYDGPLDSTHRADNLNDIPLSHEVTSYPTEFSYEKLPEHVIPVVIEETEKKDEPSLKSKITGLFKKSSAHSDYPISEQYDGPLDSTHRADNLNDIPLSHEVTSYPTEFSYEKLPEHVIPVVIEETEKKDEPSLKSKITGLFKKSSAHSDYPISDQYDGPLDSTHRADDVQDVPLSHEVTSYPTEFSYEKLPEHVIPVVIEETEKKDEPSLKSKITGLFKKSSAHSDYPISEQYDGPLDSTHRADNLNDIPLSHEVTSYPTEFSYEKLPEHFIPVVIEETEKKDEPSLKSKITGLFKKSSAHSDYPISEQYDGPLDSTHRADNLNDIPLSHEVTSYPTEFSYEKLPEHVIPVVIEETEKKDEPSLKSKITGMFKKSSAHSDYPISEQYDGPLVSTHRADNLNDIPLSHEVTSYPTEFSYEKLPEHVIPVVIEETEKKDEPSLKSKITGLFKKSSAHSDYPISEQYDGPLDSTHRADNLNDIPLSHEVTSYPTEFSYEKLPEHFIPVVIEESEKKDEPPLKSKITGLFKKSSAHSDYPISEQYDGPLDSTHRADNLNDIPLSHEVTSYPTEFSYEKLPEHVIPVVIEETEKKDEPSLKSKITGLFKKSSAHSDYPISEQYDGPLDSTHRADNLNDIPFSHEVTSYPTEFSYEKLPEHVIPVVIEETEKKDEPSLKSKITGLFKKSPSHLDYPISEQYDGPLDSTHRSDNLNDIPLSHEVTSYPTEFSYEKLPEYVIPVVIEESEKKDEPSLKLKITGLFKKSSAHSDYPISDQYDGPLDTTHRADDVQDVPLSHEVTSYPTEFSYEKLPEYVIPVVIEESEKKDEPSLKLKITGLFKKSSAHSDYPISDQYDGPLDTTHRADDVQDVPLSHEVTSYPTEFSRAKLQDVAQTIEKDTGDQYSNVALGKRSDSNSSIEKLSSGVSLLMFKDTAALRGSGNSEMFKAVPAVSEVSESNLSRHIYTRRETEIMDPAHSACSVFSHTEIRHQGNNSDDHVIDIETSDGYQPIPENIHQRGSDGTSKPSYMWSKYETEKSRLSRREPTLPSENILNASDLPEHHLYSYSETDTIHRSSLANKSSPASIDKHPDFDISFNIIPQERPKEDLGFSVSISARSPLPPLTIDESPQLLSVENLIHSHSSPRQRRLSPHTWTTVRETSEVSYIKRVTVTSSTDYGKNQATLRRDRSPIQAVARHVHSFPSTSHQSASTTCRWTTFDDPALQVHHPIYPPSQSLYKSTPKTERASYLTNGESSTQTQRNGAANCHNGNGATRSYGKVREIHAHDRTEVLRDTEVRHHRREDVFTVGTPFVMGRVEADERGNEYLRYNRHEELPMIEDGAMECRRSTVRARLREMDEVRLVGEREEIERQRRPIRRARQRVRNICTML
ncbi:63 kDa sperm flagellar membrane protein [Caenorhabditis elegans]|uniref:63 kDa sperm flagellar membrane protein n=1 Tax=Caenorhabditis elegans TaxID=6239 RepID=G5EBP5_CAEEL|nr:63 kDa sperm flagellar membrane protein [Caenorhabditis elegans]CAB02312.3 63 kDa sperm flagellar membrane protein [Caenorhabditis elegans]|eukprot:NP_492698.3 Uncharacterized protein CELE_ZC247.1 [Caenorhabditis elegans]